MLTLNNMRFYVLMLNVLSAYTNVCFLIVDASVPGETPDFYEGKAESN